MRVEAAEDEREQGRARGDQPVLPKFREERPSDDVLTGVYSKAAVEAALAGAVLGDDEATVAPTATPKPRPAPKPPVPPVHADDDWEDHDGMTKVRSRDPGAADAQIPGVPIVPKPKGSTTARPPPHSPPRRATLNGATAGGLQRPPPGVPRPPVPPLAATLSRVRTEPDQRTTIEAPAPATAERPAAVTMMSAGAPSSAAQLAAKVARQFSDRIARTAVSGKNVSHCGGQDCTNDPAGVCECGCDRCWGRRRLLAHVRMEVLGPTSVQRHAARVRHGELVAKLHEKGHHVAHCHGSQCRPAARERESDVDTLLPEEHCTCPCDGCVDMRKLLANAFGQIAAVGVT